MLYPLSYEGQRAELTGTAVPSNPTTAGQRNSAITFAKLSRWLSCTVKLVMP